jgi:hypothetical protein
MASKPGFAGWKWKKDGGGSSKRKREEPPPLPKKHRVAEFARGQAAERGVARKVDIARVRNLLTDPDVNVVVRLLGPVVEAFSSQQSVFLEITEEEDRIGGLEKEVADLKEKNLTEMKRNDTRYEMLATDMAQLRDRLDVSDLFLHQGMSIALRAFSDLIIDAFVQAYGKGALGFEERATWLSAPGPDGAEALVRQESVTITLFGHDKKFGRSDFGLIRALRRASSELSSTGYHSASPIEVAVALESEGTETFAQASRAVSGLFKSFFDETPKKLVRDFQEGKLKREFLTKFRPGHPPRTRDVIKDVFG